MPDDPGQTEPRERSRPPVPRTRSLLVPTDEPEVRRIGAYAWMWLGIILLAAVVYLGLSAVAEFIAPLVVAVVLGMVFVPMVDSLTRWMSRTIAAGLTLVTIVVIVIAALVGFVVGIVQQGPEIARQFRAAFTELSEWLDGRDIDIGSTDDFVERANAAAEAAVPALLEYMPSAIDVATGLLAGTFVALFILFFMLMDWPRVTRWIGSNLDVPTDLGAGIVDDATRSFREYFYVLTVSSIPVAIIVGLAAAILDVPLALTIALVTLVTSYIPFIGALIGSVFALLIAFGSGGVLTAVVMLAVILVAQGVVQPLIQTRLERDTLDIHPVASLGATVVGSVLAGVLGATLAAPVAAMLVRIRARVDAYEAGAETPGEADLALHADGTNPPA